jgi:hypothetical protein
MVLRELLRRSVMATGRSLGSRLEHAVTVKPIRHAPRGNSRATQPTESGRNPASSERLEAA